MDKLNKVKLVSQIFEDSKMVDIGNGLPAVNTLLKLVISLLALITLTVLEKE